MKKNLRNLDSIKRAPGPTPRPMGYDHLLKDPSRAAEITINIKVPKLKKNKNL